MDKRKLGKTNYDVSILTFPGVVLDEVSSSKASELVDLAISRDINYFDVAPAYGTAQYMLGPALEPYRKDIYLACKTLGRTAEKSKADLLESLAALKTDYLDVYQFHSVSSIEEVDSIFGESGAFETFEWALGEGLIKNIGFTSHYDHIAIEMFKRYEHFKTMLFPVNYAYRDKKNASVQPLAHCSSNDIGVIAITSMCQRKWLEGEDDSLVHCWYRPFEDLELASNALNYVLTLDGVTTCPPPGDEAYFRFAMDLIKDQGGSAIPPSAAELKLLSDYSDNLPIDHLLF
ncbi:MAG: aldo/keto reductase [Oscillospiraceae bacterium]|nr:aldo/keto reductase [Oscillospiraceae bacterium]